MAALMRDSLRLWSVAIKLRSWKIEPTNGFKASATQSQHLVLVSIDIQHTLVTGLHGTNDATPGVHDTLTERDDVIVHLVRAIGTSLNSRRLLKDLGHDGQVGLEVTTDGASNIAEALQDGGLELLSQGGAL